MTLWPRWSQWLLAYVLLFIAFASLLYGGSMPVSDKAFFACIFITIAFGVPATWLAYVIPLQKRNIDHKN